jgi:hypothetical protein
MSNAVKNAKEASEIILQEKHVSICQKRKTKHKKNPDSICQRIKEYYESKAD